MNLSINRLTGAVSQPIVVFFGLWRRAILAPEPKRADVSDPSKSPEPRLPDGALEAELAEAFHRYGQKFLVVDRPLTESQINIVETPIGFCPAPK